MGNKGIKGFVAGVLLMALLSATLVFASSGVNRVIHYGIAVVLNGHHVHFDEDSQPFIMDGRTFLPLRAMAEMLGLPLEFDAEQSTVHVGHADIAQMLVGDIWQTRGSWHGLQTQLEFFADGTGMAVEFLPTGDRARVFEEFLWNVDGNLIHIWDVDDEELYEELYIEIFRDAFGTNQMLRLYDIFHLPTRQMSEAITLVRSHHTSIDSEGNRIYVVQEGDTFWYIALRIYGVGVRYADIMEANGIEEQSDIQIGHILIIPD